MLLSHLPGIAGIIDILVVWFVIYKIILLVRGTKAVQLLKGILIIVIVKLLSSFFELKTIEWLVDQALTWGFLAFIIIFQPELRRALEQIGRGNIFGRKRNQAEKERMNLIESIEKAVSYMAKRRIGALISIERTTGLDEYIETGIPLDADISEQLLINIFIPNTPLHDGAVIIKDNKIAAAAGYLPLSESPLISKSLGTRHRAAMGISEVTDSLTVIVSEETGGISTTMNGKMQQELSLSDLRAYLEKTFEKQESKQTLWIFPKRGRKK